MASNTIAMQQSDAAAAPSQRVWASRDLGERRFAI